MDWAKALTPKNTEEVKSGCFIQTRKNRRGETSYRKINPVAWNGVVDWKTQVKSIFSVRTIFTIALICFIYFAYLHDYKELQNFYEETMSDPIKFCIEVNEQTTQTPSLNIELPGGLGVYEKEGDPYTLPNYPE